MHPVFKFVLILHDHVERYLELSAKGKTYFYIKVDEDVHVNIVQFLFLASVINFQHLFQGFVFFYGWILSWLTHPRFSQPVSSYVSIGFLFFSSFFPSVLSFFPEILKFVDVGGSICEQWALAVFDFFAKQSIKISTFYFPCRILIWGGVMR
ncbi:hypothetical protein VNO77_05758 [Canavalia gladiata]|uniref:Uncharacterized protein n=1 Tax=Canavalia gladiata TaxID=3824 RepID=A0AAN9N4M6_CANGL